MKMKGFWALIRKGFHRWISKLCSIARSRTFWAVTLPTDVKYSLNLLARAIGFSVINGRFPLFLGRQLLIIFHIALVFPLLLSNSVRTWAISANLNSRLTSCLKHLYAYQWRRSFDLIALLCHMSRVYISWRISSVNKRMWSSLYRNPLDRGMFI